jgi:sec-independent protein translocase protein TatC
VTLPDDSELSNMPAKPLIAHLDDLRRALLWALGALAVGMVITAGFAPDIYRILKAPLKGVVANPDLFLRNIEVTGGASIAMQTILWGGLILSAPVILFAVAWFVFPGLRQTERRAVLGGMLVAAALFAAGVLMCYHLALGPALKIMLWFNEWMGFKVEFWLVTSYVGFVLKLLLSFGLTFEIPVVLLILGHLGIINSDQLRHTRRHAIIIILILAMVITPTQDPFSMLLLAIPLIALHELCIWMIWAKERRKRLSADHTS